RPRPARRRGRSGPCECGSGTRIVLRWRGDDSAPFSGTATIRDIAGQSSQTWVGPTIALPRAISTLEEEPPRGSSGPVGLCTRLRRVCHARPKNAFRPPSGDDGVEDGAVGSEPSTGAACAGSIGGRV